MRLYKPPRGCIAIWLVVVSDYFKERPSSLKSSLKIAVIKSDGFIFTVFSGAMLALGSCLTWIAFHVQPHNISYQALGASKIESHGKQISVQLQGYLYFKISWVHIGIQVTKVKTSHQLHEFWKESLEPSQDS